MRLAHIAQSVERSPLKRMAAGSIPVVGIRRCFFFSRAAISVASNYNNTIILHPFLFLLCVINSCFFSTPKSKAKGKVPPHKNICEYHHFTRYCYRYNFTTDQTPLIKNNATYCGQARGRLAGVQRRARSVFRDDDYFCDECITNASKGWNVGGGG